MFCLIFPAIDAALEGFAVQAVMDASGSPSDLSEEFSVNGCAMRVLCLPLPIRSSRRLRRTGPPQPVSN